MTGTLDVTPKTTEQNLAVYRGLRIGKVTVKDCARGIVTLKLTTDTIRYDSVYLTCSKKLTGNQLSLPHGINKN